MTGMKPLRKELEKRLGDGESSLDLTPIIREYVAGIGGAHEAVRAELKVDAASSDKVISGIIESYENATGQAASELLCLAGRRPDGTLAEHSFVSTQMTEARLDYCRRNSGLGNLHTRFVRS